MLAPKLNRRDFIALAAGAAAASSFRSNAAVPASHALARPFLVTSAGCGRATGYAEASKIVTVGQRTHVAWLDADEEGFWVRIRTLDRGTGTWSPATTVGTAHDNHGGPGLTVDSKGYLHLVYFPHHQPFRYRRSQRPNDASAWEPEIRFGDELSYPVLLCASDDTLLMSARRSHQRPPETKHQPWELEWWAKPAGGNWRRERTVLRSRHTAYTHFMESLAWGSDGKTIHLGCRIYETTGRKDETPLQTIGYLRSPDAGKTWCRADGARVTLPATAETVDVLASGGGDTQRTLSSGAMAVNRDGVPHLLYSLREGNSAHTWLATSESGGGWTRRDLHEFLPPSLRDWDLVAPGGMTFSASGRATIVATLAKLGPGETDWAHATNDIARLWSDDGCRTFQSEVLGPAGAKRPRWMPGIERPTGHHPIPHQPGILFTAGSGGAGLTERTLNNEVWWAPGGGF